MATSVILLTTLAWATATADASVLPSSVARSHSHSHSQQMSMVKLTQAADASAVTEDETDGSAVAPNDSAGDPCKTSWTQVNDYITGALIFSFKASTYWCWNGSTVTSHRTSYSWSTTSWGYLNGYHWQGGYILFNCYVASGSSKSCSGNHESVVGNFGIVTGTIGGGQGTTVTIDQWENYHGEYLHGYTQMDY